MQAKLQKWGNSQGIRIPKQLLLIASFKEGDEVEITAEYDKIIIRHVEKPAKKYIIEELFADYGTGTKQTEEDWGVPSGKEEL
ncbi:MAG: AbrB/MazE/SpoVT family DNA-binding domain-containing protein [Ruminiclostridium sp.]|nr:AbrB/MazE/SpoVT family DNA-binding domain-containing protein [Ruminiclostridium sp.]